METPKPHEIWQKRNQNKSLVAHASKLVYSLLPYIFDCRFRYALCVPLPLFSNCTLIFHLTPPIPYGKLLHSQWLHSQILVQNVCLFVLLSPHRDLEVVASHWMDKDENYMYINSQIIYFHTCNVCLFCISTLVLPVTAVDYGSLVFGKDREKNQSGLSSLLFLKHSSSHKNGETLH